MPDYETSKISFVVDDRLFKGLSRRALAAGSTPNLYAKDLFAAAFTARVKPPSGDEDLDAAVERLFAESTIRVASQVGVAAAPPPASNAGDDKLREEIRNLAGRLEAASVSNGENAARISQLEAEAKQSASSNSKVISNLTAARRENETLKNKIDRLEAESVLVPESPQPILDRIVELEAKNKEWSGKYGASQRMKNDAERALKAAQAELEKSESLLNAEKAEAKSLVEAIKDQARIYERQMGEKTAELEVANDEITRLRGLCIPKTVMVRAPADDWLKPADFEIKQVEPVSGPYFADAVKGIPVEFYGLERRAASEPEPSNDRMIITELERVLASNIAEINKLHLEIAELLQTIEGLRMPAPTSDRLISSIIMAWGKGMNTAEIADKTCLSERTVDRIISAWKEAQHERGK